MTLTSKSYLSIICIILFVFFSYQKIEKKILNLPLHCDEVSWLFHTEFYDALINKKTDEHFWTTDEAYDHPHLAKYVYGWYLHRYHPDLSHERNILLAKYGRWGNDCPSTETQPFSSYIMRMRDISKTLFLGTVILTLATSTLLTGFQLIYLITLYFLIDNSIFHWLLIANSDGLYIFFMQLFLFCYLLYLKSGKKTYLVISALAAGLSASSKLTGILLPVILACYIAGRFLYTRHIKHGLAVLTVFLYLFIFVWFITNPTIYKSPIAGSVQFFQYRHEAMLRQRVKSQYWQEYETPKRIAGVAQRLFEFNQEGRFQLQPISLDYLGRGIVGITLYIAGLTYSVKKARKKNILYVFFLMFSISFTTLTFTVLMLPWDRYLLPILALVIIFQLLGAHWILGLFRHIMRGRIITRKSTHEN